MAFKGCSPRIGRRNKTGGETRLSLAPVQQRTMSSTEHAAWLEAFANDGPKALQVAEQLDHQLKARKAGVR